MYKTTILIALFLFAGCHNDKNTTTVDPSALNDNISRHTTTATRDPMFSLDTDSVKKVYGNRYTELRNIINKHDPIKLIVNNSDAVYELQVMTIIIQLDSNGSNQQQVHDLVYQEFARGFDEDILTGPKESYMDLAKEIYKWTQKQRPANRN